MPTDELQYKSDSDLLGLVQTPKVKGHGPPKTYPTSYASQKSNPRLTTFPTSWLKSMCGGW